MSPIVAAVIVALILITALYVAAEFAAVSVRRSRLQQRAEEGDRLAQRLLPVIMDGAKLDRYIAASQVGITLSSLILGAYGQATLGRALIPVAQRFGLEPAAATSVASITVLIALTVLAMVFGELVPKSLALQFPTQMARWTVIPMAWSTRVMRWLIDFLNGSGVFLLRLVGQPATGHRHIHSPAEIEYLIAESREGGQLEPAESARLRQALRLSLRTVGELMVPRMRIVGVPLHATGAEVLELLRKTPYSRLPVYDETLDQVLGVLHVRDVAARLVGTNATMPRIPLRDLLRPVLVVPESMTADRLLERLRVERRAMAIVADEFGGTAGLITVGDMLDELLGETADEFKLGDVLPQRLPDGRVRLPGTVRLDLAAPWVGVLWEADSYTVAGFLMEKLGRLPVAGDRLEVDGVRIEVERMRGRVVESLLVTPAPKSEGGA